MKNAAAGGFLYLLVVGVLLGVSTPGPSVASPLPVRWIGNASSAAPKCSKVSLDKLIRMRHDLPLRDACISGRLGWYEEPRGSHHFYVLPDGEEPDGDVLVELDGISVQDENRFLQSQELKYRVLVQGSFTFAPTCWNAPEPHKVTVCWPVQRAVTQTEGELYVLDSLAK